jgi:hypothetical protein
VTLLRRQDARRTEAARATAEALHPCNQFLSPSRPRRFCSTPRNYTEEAPLVSTRNRSACSVNTYNEKADTRTVGQQSWIALPLICRSTPLIARTVGLRVRQWRAKKKRRLGNGHAILRRYKVNFASRSRVVDVWLGPRTQDLLLEKS